jgi:hypothetical protein
MKPTSPHIKISYDNASGYGYKYTHINDIINNTSTVLFNSFDKASSHQTISVFKPSKAASFFQS